MIDGTIVAVLSVPEGEYPAVIHFDEKNIKEFRNMSNSRVNVHNMTVIAMLSAVAFILQFFEFSVPLMPAFIKLDLSDLPALIGAYAVGPVGGVVVALIKNVIHLTVSSSGGVGELSNFILNAIFVLPAGIIYRKKKTKGRALAGAVLGAVLMSVLSVFTNYYIIYPVYYNFMPKETIVAAYQVIYPGVKTILQCLIVFNLPFTFIKAMISVVITFLIYKHISPVLKKIGQKNQEL